MTTPENGEKERREAAYPYYDLESSIKLSSSIKDLGGSKGAVRKSLLAKQVGLAESTPSFFQRLSGAKVFGLIEGWGQYGLTELGKKYFYPQSEKDKSEAILTAFSTPSAFRILLGKFDGEKLPSTEIIGNILHQEAGVPDSWKDRVAQIFARSASFAGIIDSNGFLRYDAGMHGNKTEPSTVESQRTESQEIISKVADHSAVDSTPPMTRYPRKPDAPPSGYSQWLFPVGGTYIRLDTPENMTKAIWEKLNAYVQILKPEDEAK